MQYRTTLMQTMERKMDKYDEHFDELKRNSEEVNEFCTRLNQFYYALEKKLIDNGAFFSAQVHMKDIRLKGVMYLMWGRIDKKWQLVIKGEETKPLVQSSRYNRVVAYDHVGSLLDAVLIQSRIARGMVEAIKGEMKSESTE